MSNNQNLVGMITVIAGVVLFIVSAGDLLIRVLGGIIGLIIIDYGLQQQGLPRLQSYITKILNFRP